MTAAKVRSVPPLPGKVPAVSPADVTRYGALLHEAAHGGGSCFCDEQPLVRAQFDRYVQVMLTALAADGRLTEAPGPPAS